MTSVEFKAACKSLGWKYEDAKEHLGKSVVTIKRYATGAASIPTAVAERLTSMLPDGGEMDEMAELRAQLAEKEAELEKLNKGEPRKESAPAVRSTERSMVDIKRGAPESTVGKEEEGLTTGQTMVRNADKRREEYEAQTGESGLR